MSKDVYVGLLRQFVCKIIFTKADGTERTLIGTLRQDIIGIPLDTKERTTVIKRPNGVIRVFDLEKNMWRSFKPETVKEFHIEGRFYDRAQ